MGLIHVLLLVNKAFEPLKQVADRGIPAEFAAVPAGHVHRFQVLSRNLKDKMLPAALSYAGSIDRTSFVENNEKKGYLILEFELERVKGEN